MSEDLRLLLVPRDRLVRPIRGEVPQRSGVEFFELETGHDAMILMPERVAEILQR